MHKCYLNNIDSFSRSDLVAFVPENERLSKEEMRMFKEIVALRLGRKYLESKKARRLRWKETKSRTQNL